MKFSENWLRSLVPIEADRALLIERLTMAGLEVESAQAIGTDCADVVVGKILSVLPHPDAGRLRVCSVDAGADAPIQIVCGAPNARAGLCAPLARVGARLPGGVEIKAAVLRGVESSGMLCSARELGLDADATGLMELPADSVPGASLASVLDLPDASIELKLTPNRADCFGMEGLANEVGALFGVACVSKDAVRVPVESRITRAAALNAGAACPRYLTRAVEAIDASATTPAWMRARLLRGGVRPVSVLVDIGNYVMLETGQPTHLFDLAKVEEGLEVRWGSPGERLQLLDGSEVVVPAGTLLVADHRGPLALAGIMGGMPSRVTDATREVLIEAAHFAPEAIAARARRFALNSEAAHRFERGVDPGLPKRAIERVAQLLAEICGGRAGEVVEVVLPEAFPHPAPIRLRASRILRLLGIAPERQTVEAVLKALGMRIEAEPAGWQITPPARRFDLRIEEDLIEEIARVVGYEHIPSRVPEGAISAPRFTEGRLEPAALADSLRHRGYTEALHFSFVDAALLDRWNLGEAAVALANPLSGDLGVMRTALLPGLVQTLSRNLDRQQARVRLFEIGRVFVAADAPGAAPVERLHIAGCATGTAVAEEWGSIARAMDFHDLKGDIEQMLRLTGADGHERFGSTPVPQGWLHPGQGASLTVAGAGVGGYGALSPRLQHALDIDAEVYVFEFELEPLLKRDPPRAASPSRFPSVRRDLALILPENTPFAELEACVRHSAGPHLQSLVLFDRFVGAELPPGCKSVAIGLILQDPSRTLGEEDVADVVASVVAAAESGLGAKLRS